MTDWCSATFLAARAVSCLSATTISLTTHDGAAGLLLSLPLFSSTAGDVAASIVLADQRLILPVLLHARLSVGSTRMH